MLASVNYWAVLVAAVAAYAIGAFWFSPLGFGKAWVKLQKIDAKKMKQMMANTNMKVSYGGSFLGQLLTAFVLAQILALTGIATLTGALELAFWVWLGFVATVQAGKVFWNAAPWSLWFLETAHNLVSLLVVAAILVSWV